MRLACRGSEQESSILVREDRRLLQRTVVTERRALARYFFDTKVRNSLVRDTDGLEFSSDGGARAFAYASTAAFAEVRIRRNERLDDLYKIVRAENGRTIDCFSFAEALRRVALGA